MDNEQQNYRCDCNVIHQDIIDNVSSKMPEEKKALKLADFFKVFGDGTRIKILYALFNSEMCVCDISSLLNMNQSAISHQLRILKQARLIKNRKDGKVVYYSLDDEHVAQILNDGVNHIDE
ncbi:metalloregulator ArsR/SmtB family transcription factor [Alkalibaculum sp. M08DMB]|uniref:Metalloregulator ArsR/SmtB family transcription factor n=1 Tax=Alkalibaculum sporogenes TaxID=2655001 RepID=A0A6A7KC66_9FIRM|nr:metalloregulator ArsR/SmtB family transcription factor [Alkalibaculum sporogenes]MPW27139.1 metalloregulator ArsR/SmtB family transcription factor [Alkalibaculum sporogenes]